MAKICFPHHRCGEFSSLNEAFHYLRKIEYGWSWFTLTEIVKCNVYYRDYLREYGIDSLIKMIIEEVPELAEDNKALNHLREWTLKENIAKYDIQCYNINDEITILGRTFNGLKDIMEHFELYGDYGYFGLQCWPSPKNIPYDDVHIGHLYKSYPRFDSYDLSDDRTYQNYIFRNTQILETDMKDVISVSHRANFCMVHEEIPEDNLPILYYSGVGQYMLLASK